jgi:hypothetical protein
MFSEATYRAHNASHQRAEAERLEDAQHQQEERLLRKAAKASKASKKANKEIKAKNEQVPKHHKISSSNAVLQYTDG